jgi:hypothetical protein
MVVAIEVIFAIADADVVGLYPRGAQRGCNPRCISRSSESWTVSIDTACDLLHTEATEASP